MSPFTTKKMFYYSILSVQNCNMMPNVSILLPAKQLYVPVEYKIVISFVIKDSEKVIKLFNE